MLTRVSSRNAPSDTRWLMVTRERRDVPWAAAESFARNCFGENERMAIPCFRLWPVLLVVLAVPGVSAQLRYQTLLKGGHVIDPRNNVDAVMDVAIADGKIAAVRARDQSRRGPDVVDVSGLYVTPGLIDAHVHVFATTGMRGAGPATTACCRTSSVSARESPPWWTRELGVAQFRRFPKPRHRSRHNAGLRDVEHRWTRHVDGRPRTEVPTWTPTPPPRWR